MTKPPLVSNTSPLLYLGRLGQAELLQSLFGEVFVPEQVALELDTGRLLRSDTIDPRRLSWVTLATVSPSMIDSLPVNRLGYGERFAIAYAASHPGYVLALDDRQARLLAIQLKVPVIGTVGVLIRAKQADLISTVQPLMDSLRQEGFRLSDALYHQALKLAGEI